MKRNKFSLKKIREMHKDSIDKTGKFRRMVKKLIEQIGMDKK